MGRTGNEKITVRTPLIYSKPLSDIADRCVYLKLENTQPSGSFKLRGISHLCKEKYAEGCTKFIGASGGNAGLALAYSAEKLGVPCQIFVPETVVPRVIQRLSSYRGVQVIVGGKDIQESSELAMREEAKDPVNYSFVHPFNNPSIWEGHSVIIDELQEDLRGRVPACIALSVGGGGMLMGLLLGMERAGWKGVPILALETRGCECFHKSFKSGTIVDVNPTSIAKTLGCRSPAPKLMEKVKEFNVISKVLDDSAAAMGCVHMAEDHCMMVEPSCGVTLASVYNQVLPDVLEEYGYDSRAGPIVLIVCGGSDITADTIKSYESNYALVD
jgi:L-serine/L-threonine ammonia-lyase